MLSPDKPTFAQAPLARFRTPGFSAPQIGVLFAAFHAAHAPFPIWTHPLPPLSITSIIWRACR